MSDLYEELTEREDAISVLNRLAENVNSSYYDIGCILYTLKENDIYKTMDGNKYYSDTHSNWKRFCEDKLNVSYRTAQYWLNLYHYFDKMGITKDRIKHIGWSKVKELIDLTDDVNVLERAIVVAEEGTIQDLKAHIAIVESMSTPVGEDNREQVKSKKLTFVYYEAAADAVTEVLEEIAKENNGSMSEALFQLCVEYKQNKNYVPDLDDMVIVQTGTLDDNGQELPTELIEHIGI